MLTHHKIIPFADIADHVEKLRRGQRGAAVKDAASEGTALRVVFTNGCYDLLHPGHVDLLARARMLGDVLVLGLNTDASVRRLNKPAQFRWGFGEPELHVQRPVQSLAVRAYMAAHLASVDVVTYFDEDTPWELVRRVQPDVLVKGGDWPVEQIVGRDIVEARGGLVVSLPLLDGFSTTALLERIMLGGGPGEDS